MGGENSCRWGESLVGWVGEYRVLSDRWRRCLVLVEVCDVEREENEG